MNTKTYTTVADEASRQETLLKLLKQFGHIDVLNRDAVNAYAEATGAAVKMMPFGADKCPQLGRDLSRMHGAGLVERCATGLTGMAGMGFPRWVYSYHLPKTLA